ncbi:MAG: ATP synthase subunit I, partial [Desulfomonilia bacterium]
MPPITSKDPAQRRIEFLSAGIWLVLCTAGFFLAGPDFALSVLIGGLVCMVNFQWVYRHAKTAVTLTARQGRSFMARRYVIRLAT